MRSRKLRFLLMAAALAALAGGAGRAADDKGPVGRAPGSKAEADKGGGVTGHLFAGQVADIDSKQRRITLADRGGPAGVERGGVGKDLGTDRPIRDRDNNVAPTARVNTYIFIVDDRARITLDGKPATFSDLKPGMFARVEASHRTPGAAPPADKGAPDRGTSSAADKGVPPKSVPGKVSSGVGTAGTAPGGTGPTGQPMTAFRIEAFTKGGVPDRGTGSTRDKVPARRTDR
jgi:hypothetical protein